MKPKLFKKHGVWWCMSDDLTTVGNTLCDAYKAWHWKKLVGYKDSIYG